jgi:hypothetical protein
MTHARWRTRLLAGAAALACLASVSCQAEPDRTAAAESRKSGSPAPSPSPSSSPSMTTEQRSAWLTAQLRAIVDEQRFGEVLDRAAGRRVVHMPNVDVAVIELDKAGRPVAAAEVLLSKQYPRAVSVPVDQNLAATSVRWRRWSGDRWRSGGAGGSEVMPAGDTARLDFMTPYPASVFKLLVAFGTFRLIDQGKATLDGPYSYQPRGDVCPAGRQSGTRSVRSWLDGMLTYSDNLSTCALIKQLHDHDAVDDLNDTFAGLGLGTLQLGSTRAADGGGWLRDKITMTGLDTARLLLLVSGAPGVLWRGPKGTPVTADVLSPSSRAAYLKILGDQGLNHALSTANFCGRGYPAPGIPQRVPERWIAAGNGTVSVHGRQYRQDVRPCNARAEVTFAHKTGLVDDAGADAGIVTSLPGAPQRRYIVAIFTNLGSSFGDAKPPATCTGNCSTSGVYYSEKFARIGARIDALFVPATPGRPAAD